MVVSTNTEAKYLPEGVMLTVTVFTIPLNLRCSTAGISLAFGMVIVPFSKSTRQCWGQRKLCLSLRLLKRGKPTDWVLRKKLVYAVSRLRNALCNDWELTSDSHSCSAFRLFFIRLVKYTLPSVSLRSWYAVIFRFNAQL